MVAKLQKYRPYHNSNIYEVVNVTVIEKCMYNLEIRGVRFTALTGLRQLLLPYKYSLVIFFRAFTKKCLNGITEGVVGGTLNIISQTGKLI